MPYRIKAKNAQGDTVTRMDQNVNAKPITSRADADRIAQSFADTRGHGGPWKPIVEYYEGTISSPRIEQLTATTIPAGHVRVELDPYYTRPAE